MSVCGDNRCLGSNKGVQRSYFMLIISLYRVATKGDAVGVAYLQRFLCFVGKMK